MQSPQSAQSPVSTRRSFLALTGATAAGSLAALAGFPAFTAAAAEPNRPAVDPRVTDGGAVRLWYTAPAAEQALIQ
jgi:alpha-L-fucosidase 2